jgi:(5-formylfuran-3-yl)methyl phosphate synthase
MRLLISVADAMDARAALKGGADIIDAKDPSAGALGAVTLPTFLQIRDAVSKQRPVSAALGDAVDAASVEMLARAFARAGATFVKVGFAGISSDAAISRLLHAAVRGARAVESPHASCHVMAVAYADEPGPIPLASMASVALGAGAHGVLVDTRHKAGPGLRPLSEGHRLDVWIKAARANGLTVALAGQLAAEDLAFVRDAGADIAGLRGAACEGGRLGRIVVDKVRQLRERCT